jgi:DNA helicase HerA-like ATPase
MADFEKLGIFYLGRVRDAETKSTTAEPLLYESKDLVTHAVCVGMTGSGKTGLGIGLIEEAAIDGIPAIVIDPKGDMGNLLLAFPELAASDFRPYVDEAEAARQSTTADELASATARRWREGLAAWGQDGARVARLKAAAEFAIYTPGSRAGRPLSILSSLAAPPPGFADDSGAMRDRVASATSGLLALAGIEADPMQSREHILVANLLDRAWRAGRGVDLAGLVHEVQEPGLERVGVLPLESFFPAKDRFALAMRFNNLAASPGFSAWAEGEPLDVQRLLYGAEGKPRVSILSIAHLSEAERMFFVTVLLNEVLAWTRRQAGTSSLRALLYMDEIFGYFPPTANPPSKALMLTLLKQARAFGLGIVLSTQNPVDLDYRGLSNAGTWFIGRLQTERDKARVVEGLTSAAAGEGLDRGELDRLMGSLGSRVFLMRNVHEAAPVLFETRWCLSYLRGPLSAAQIGALSAPLQPEAPAPEPGPAAVEAPTPGAVAAAAKMALPPAIEQVYLRPEGAIPGGDAEYRPALLAEAQVRFADARQGIDEWQTRRLLVPVDARGEPQWEEARPAPDVEGEPPPPSAPHATVPPALADAKRYAQMAKQGKSWLMRSAFLEVYRVRSPKVSGRPGEGEGDVRVRAAQLLREARDEALEKYRGKQAKRLAALAERERRAAAKIASEQAQLSRQRVGTAVSFGAAALSMLLGRKAGGMGRAATGIHAMNRSRKEQLDVEQARQSHEAVLRQRAELEAETERELARIAEDYDPGRIEVEAVRLGPRSADTVVRRVALAWVAVPRAEGMVRA